MSDDPSTTTVTTTQLKLFRITPLSAPGPDSNYLDWSFVARLHFCSPKLDHVLKRVHIKDRKTLWDNDNTAVCSQISHIVINANYKHIWDFEDDAAGMWDRLRVTPQDRTSGSQVYWLQKLMLMRMDSGSDVGDHINKMHAVYKRLNSLVCHYQPPFDC